MRHGARRIHSCTLAAVFTNRRTATD